MGRTGHFPTIFYEKALLKIGSPIDTDTNVLSNYNSTLGDGFLWTCTKDLKSNWGGAITDKKAEELFQRFVKGCWAIPKFAGMAIAGMGVFYAL